MARSQIHDVGPRDSLDKFVLIAAFILGASGSIALKIWEVPAILAALYPVAILLLYVLACFRSKALSIEPETVGDNCYYLGFLFTLTSLAVTLYQIRGISSSVNHQLLDSNAPIAKAEDLIPLVISGFGIALSSTIFGVFLRVVLMQLRSDIVSRDRETRLDLARGTREFRDSIAMVSRELKTMSVEAAQHAAERNAKINDITDEQLSKVNEMLVRQSSNFDKTLQDFATKLGEDVSKTLDREMRKATGDLKTSSNELALSLTELSKVQKEEVGIIRDANIDLRNVSNEFKAAMSTRQNELLASYRDLTQNSEQIVATLKEAMASVQSGSKSLSSSSDIVTSNHSAIIGSYQKLAESSGKISAVLDEAIETLSSRAEKTQGFYDKHEKALEARTQSFISRGESLDASVNQVEEALKKSAKEIEAIAMGSLTTRTPGQTEIGDLPPTEPSDDDSRKRGRFGRLFGNG